MNRTCDAPHADEAQTFGQRLADRVAQLGGSWGFIVVFASLLVAWVVLNTFVLTRFHAGFDEYPNIFLNLILSMVAALQATVILMAQNRQAARDRQAAALDYDVDLKAQAEITSLHEKIDLILSQHAVAVRRVDELNAAVPAMARRQTRSS